MTQPIEAPPRPSRRARRAARRSWYLVIPVVLFGWNAAALLGYAAHLILFEFCPHDLVTDGRCLASWFDPAERVVRIGAASLGALLAIVLTLLVQPVRPIVVAWVVFSIGTVVAALVAWGSRSIALFAVATVSGLITVSAVTWWYRKRGSALEPTARW